MTKKLIPILFLFLLNGFASSAQQGIINKRKYDDVVALKTATLKVVLDPGKTKYNDSIKAVMNRYWTFCKFTYVPSFNKNDKDGFYLVKLDMGGDSGPGIIGVRRGTLDGQKSTAEVFIAPKKDCSYILPNLIFRIQNLIQFISENPTIDIMETYSSLMAKEREFTASDIKDKTLYILKSDLSEKFTEENLKAIYPFQYKLVTEQQINEAINNKDEEVFYLYNMVRSDPTPVDGHTLQIAVAKNGEVIYSMVGGNENLNKQDIQKLVKEINAPPAKTK